MNRYAFQRRDSWAVPITTQTGKELIIGGAAPMVVQSMTTTPTQDIAATVAQCIELAEAGMSVGAHYRTWGQDAQALGPIREQFSAAGFADIPLVADIHFMPAAALAAAEFVEKVRINPGNFADKKRFAVTEYSDADYAAELDRVADKFLPLVKKMHRLGRTMRIGVNHGSLSDRIMNRFGDTPAGMVESALEFCAIAEAESYRNIVISMKSSNPKVMIQAYRLLAQRLDERGTPYPLHLGVTEAGDGEDGRVKGACGIGALLADGIGDTIRVSLTEDPVAEIPVAQELADLWQQVPTAPLHNPPPEAIDPHAFTRRPAEITRLGHGEHTIAIGGGQVPKVIAPLHTPTADADEPGADIALRSAPPAMVSKRCQAPVLIDGDGSAGDLRLLNLPTATDPVAWLRAAVAETSGDTALGITDPGDIDAVRAYRLLAAISEEAFQTAEATASGSGLRHAIVLALPYEENLLRAASICGSLLADGIGDAIYLPALPLPQQHAFTILQAMKSRITRADYVACPSCGRTLFDLMEVTAHIKEATDHLDGVTIAIMGCIVNGPGEMADADFGFVGSGPGKITLYRGREPVQRNIPFADARGALVDLIKANDMWRERPGDATTVADTTR